MTHQIFFSYTKDLEAEAAAIYQAFEGDLDVEIHDWLVDPGTVGNLWDRLGPQIDGCDVFVALIGDRYGEKIGAEECKYICRVWHQKRRLFVPVIFGQKGQKWWQEFLDQEATPSEFGQFIWKSFIRAGRPISFFLDVGDGKAALSQHAKNYLGDLTTELQKKFEGWKDDDGYTDTDEAESDERSSTNLLVLGGPDWSLEDIDHKLREELISELNQMGLKEQVKNIGDRWFDVFNEDNDELHNDLNRSSLNHVVAVGDVKLLKALNSYDGERRLRRHQKYLSAIEQTFNLEGKSKKIVWVPSFNDRQAFEANNSQSSGLEYAGGKPADLAKSIQPLLCAANKAHLIVQGAAVHKQIEDWVTKEFPPKINLNMEVESDIFIGVESLIDLLTSYPKRARSPIIVAIGDESIRAPRGDITELKKEIKRHISEYENQIANLRIDHDEGRIFRVFLQYQHSAAAALQPSVNNRDWQVLKFKDPANALPCPDCLDFLQRRFSMWYHQNFSVAQN